MRTIFERAVLFNGFEEPLVDMTVVIEGDRIAEVAPDGSGFPRVESDRIVDLDGRMLMPGMTLAHWHPDYVSLDFDDLVHVNLGLQKPLPYLAVMAAKYLKNLLLSGYTGVAGAGCPGDLDASLKMAVAEGAIDGPHIMAAGRHINTTGNDNHRGKWWYDHRPAYQAGISKMGSELFADGPDAMRRAVRDEIHRGVDVIKIFPVGGHGFERDPDYQCYAQDELAAIVGAAHDRGVPVRAHVTGADNILRCIAAGVDIIDHGDGADDACINAMLKAGTILVPSMIFLKTLIDAPDGTMSASVLKPVREDFDHMVGFLPRAHAAGVKIVPGDDYGLSFLPHVPGIYSRDLLIHVEQVGISARDVIGWATVHGATLMRRPDAGKIVPGFIADLVVVDGDPTQNLAILTDPERYILGITLGGRFVKDALNKLPKSLPDLMRNTTAA